MNKIIIFYFFLNATVVIDAVKKNKKDRYTDLCLFQGVK
jgi:hypothetical protein